MFGCLTSKLHKANSLIHIITILKVIWSIGKRSEIFQKNSHYV